MVRPVWIRIIIIEIKPVRIVIVWVRIIIVLVIFVIGGMVVIGGIVVIGRGVRIIVVVTTPEGRRYKNTTDKKNTQFSHAHCS